MGVIWDVGRLQDRSIGWRTAGPSENLTRAPRNSDQGLQAAARERTLAPLCQELLDAALGAKPALPVGQQVPALAPRAYRYHHARVVCLRFPSESLWTS